MIAPSKTKSKLDTQRVCSLRPGAVPGAAFTSSFPALIGFGGNRTAVASIS